MAGGRALIAAYAPRNLNEPVGCSDSGLISSLGATRGNGISGVRTITPSRRSAADRISSTDTSRCTGQPYDLPGLPRGRPSYCKWVFRKLGLKHIFVATLRTGVSKR